MEREKKWIRTKMKSFHSGYSDQEVRIKVCPFKSFQLCTIIKKEWIKQEITVHIGYSD